MVLFFLDLSARKLEIVGIAAHANGLWMSQIGRNLTNSVDGLLRGKRYLIHYRDPLFTTEFLKMPTDAGLRRSRFRRGAQIGTPHAERFREGD